MSVPRWLRALRKIGVLPHVVLYPRVTLQGRRTRIPFHHGIGWLHYTQREEWMDELLRRLLPHAPGTFVDVGANIGQTWLRVRALAPSMPYLGFEPNPAAAAYIEELARANGWGPPRVVPAALADRDGPAELTLFQGDPTDGTASLIPDLRAAQPSAGRIIVPCYTFATVERSLPTGPLGLVKIDVEGGELAVVKGMYDRLQHDRPAIIVEVLPAYTADNRARLDRQEELEELLRRLGYALHRIVHHAGPMHLQRITGAIGVHGDLALTDYVALTPAQADRVQDLVRD